MPFSAYYAYAGAAILLLELFHFCQQRKLYDLRTKLFIVMFTNSILLCLGNIGLTIQIRLGYISSYFTMVIAVVTYLAQFAMPYLLLRMSCLTARKTEQPLMYVGTMIFVVGGFAIITNPWTHIISYPGEDDMLHVGSMYPLFVWGILINYVVDFFIVIYQGKDMKHRQRPALAEACIVMISSMIMQNIFHARLVVGFAAALSMVVIYLYMQSPYAYIDLTTRIFNDDYFDYWIWEYSVRKKEIFLLVVKLGEKERCNSLGGADVEINQKVAEQLWKIAPGHRVFRVSPGKYAIISTSESEYRRTVKQVQEELSSQNYFLKQNIKCPIVLVCLPHAEKLCSHNIHEMMDYVRFILRQVKYENELQVIEGTTQLQEQFLYEQEIEQYLDEAVKNDSFEVWYQLIWSIPEQRFIGMEALSRLHHPKLGWINPELFVRLAVKNGQIFNIMPQQIRKICRFWQTHSIELSEIETVKINLSPAELVKEGYCEQLIEIIRSYDIPMEMFQFEVTETDATEYTKELERCIQILQKNGIQLCLDDFGSGYANLSNILQLPFSVVKMDRSLLQGICENKTAAIFYHSMIDTLHSIGYQIVSEGVETEQEAELLADWNVDMIQGYYYAKPQSAESVLMELNMVFENN